MQIDVEAGPNVPSSEQFVFNELGRPRRVQALRVELGGREMRCEVTGVAPANEASAGTRGVRWVPARAVKINDSSEGHAFLIYGGEWGIRLKSGPGPWDLSDRAQWGEPFKVYGSEEDIIYADA